ncbi:hypothetical protein C6A85_94990, partial [Mycobacterium sp. ITM-2017-0098]
MIVVRTSSMRAAGLAACVSLVIASCSPGTSEPTGSQPATTTATASAPVNPALKPMDATSFRALVERLVADL